MVIFLRTAHFVLAAVDLVIFELVWKVPSESKGLGGLDEKSLPRVKGLGGLELILDSTVDGVPLHTAVIIIKTASYLRGFCSDGKLLHSLSQSCIIM